MVAVKLFVCKNTDSAIHLTVIFCSLVLRAVYMAESLCAMLI